MLDRVLAAARWHPLLVAFVAALIAFPGLWSSPLSSSEGHRVVPAAAMLRSGDWLRLELFETTYLRKPPGMPWAIATSSSLVGETEFAARLPSALGFVAMALVAWRFASRWFGGSAPGGWPAAGLVAGLTQALMPVLWPWARSAEIEGLHALGSQVAALTMLAIVMPRESATPARAAARAAVLALAVAAMAILKGPAGAPVLIGVLIGACVATRSARPLASGALWLALGLAAAILAPLAWAVAARNPSDGAVTQGVDEFLWSIDRLGGVALLIPTALAAALPASLGLLTLRMPARSHSEMAARALGVGFLAALALFAVLGVSNHRYAIPAMPLLPPLLAFAAARAFADHGSHATADRGLFRVLLLGHPFVLPAALLAAAAVAIPLAEASRARHGGREAGRLLALALADHADSRTRVVLLADGMIDARPDVCWYLQRALPSVRVRWAREELARPTAPPPAVVLLLRTDPARDERARFASLLDRGDLRVIAEGRVSGYSFVLVQRSATLDDRAAEPPRSVRPE